MGRGRRGEKDKGGLKRKGKGKGEGKGGSED